MIRINDDITIADWEITERFVRSSGPGGQHVNKTSSAVELRFEAARSPNLSDPVKTRLRRLSGRKWTSDGAIIITAEAHRSQKLNRELAATKLAELIISALHRPKPRIKTRPSLGAKRRRVDAKTNRGAVKRLRGSPKNSVDLD